MLALAASPGSQVRENQGQDPRRYPRLAAQRAAHRRDQLLDRLIFGHPCGNADSYCLDRQAVINACRYHDNPQARMVRQRLASELEPAVAVQVDIEQQHIEIAFVQRMARLVNRGRRSRPYSRLGIQACRQRVREDRVVVENEDMPDWRLRESP